jgi:hypothetical protein
MADMVEEYIDKMAFLKDCIVLAPTRHTYSHIPKNERCLQCGQPYEHHTGSFCGEPPVCLTGPRPDTFTYRRPKVDEADEQRRQAEVSWENLKLRTQDHFTADTFTDAERKKLVQGQQILGLLKTELECVDGPCCGVRVDADKAGRWTLVLVKNGRSNKFYTYTVDGSSDELCLVYTGEERPDTTTATVSGVDGVVFHVPKDFGSRRKELTMDDLRRDCFPKEYTWWTRQPDDPPQEDKFRDLLSEVMPKRSDGAIAFDNVFEGAACSEPFQPDVKHHDVEDVTSGLYEAGTTKPKNAYTSISSDDKHHSYLIAAGILQK